MLKIVLRLFVLVGCILFTLTAYANPILTVNGGILTGATGISATGIDVGGNPYDVQFDVQFVDGTCSFVYTQCDNSYFPFKRDDALARSAVQSLASAIASSPFASSPNLISGCGSPTYCSIDTPTRIFFVYDGAVSLGVSVVVLPDVPAFAGGVQVLGNWDGVDYAQYDSAVFARWTEETSSVPEPTSFVVLGTGLLGMVAMSRSRNKYRN